MLNRLTEQSTVVELAQLLTRNGLRLTHLSEDAERGQAVAMVENASYEYRARTGLLAYQAINKALDALGVPLEIEQ